jgi:hypothetical protein
MQVEEISPCGRGHDTRTTSLRILRVTTRWVVSSLSSGKCHVSVCGTPRRKEGNNKLINKRLEDQCLEKVEQSLPVC